jgi:hypothetical protein
MRHLPVAAMSANSEQDSKVLLSAVAAVVVEHAAVASTRFVFASPVEVI